MKSSSLSGSSLGAGGSTRGTVTYELLESCSALQFPSTRLSTSHNRCGEFNAGSLGKVPLGVPRFAGQAFVLRIEPLFGVAALRASILNAGAQHV